MAKKFRLIIIDARRWFDRPNGNTYHTVTITIKHARRADVVLRTDRIHYGYGDHYLQTAHALLMAAGYFPKTGGHYKSGADVDYSVFLDAMRNNRKAFHITVADVQRKKDL